MAACADPRRHRDHLQRGHDRRANRRPRRGTRLTTIQDWAASRFGPVPRPRCRPRRRPCVVEPRRSGSRRETPAGSGLISATGACVSRASTMRGKGREADVPLARPWEPTRRGRARGTSWRLARRCHPHGRRCRGTAGFSGTRRAGGRPHHSGHRRPHRRRTRASGGRRPRGIRHRARHPRWTGDGHARHRRGHPRQPRAGDRVRQPGWGTGGIGRGPHLPRSTRPRDGAGNDDRRGHAGWAGGRGGASEDRQ